MNILEQKFMELVPDVLRSISKSVASIDKKMTVQQPAYVWVLFYESLDDYQLAGRRLQVFLDEEEARKAFGIAADESRRIAETSGWEVGHDDEDYFDAYPDGSWGTSHETVELKKCQVGEATWCRND